PPGPPPRCPPRPASRPARPAAATGSRAPAARRPGGCACRFLAPRCPLLGPLLLPADGLGQLRLGHAGPALDPEPPGPLVQLLLGVADGVDPPVGLAGALAGRLAAPGRLRVGGALPLLGLPVVALLLERVLDGREGGAGGPLAPAGGLGGAVVGR